MRESKYSSGETEASSRYGNVNRMEGFRALDKGEIKSLVDMYRRRQLDPTILAPRPDLHYFDSLQLNMIQSFMYPRVEEASQCKTRLGGWLLEGVVARQMDDDVM